jgi:hypothetical protein
VNKPTGKALFTVLPPNTTPLERVREVMNFNFLPDMYVSRGLTKRGIMNASSQCHAMLVRQRCSTGKSDRCRETG